MHLVVSDPKTGKAFKLEIENPNILIGKKIGDIIPGDPFGLKGYKLKITGGSDDSGFPMRPDVHGPVKKRILLSGPPGFWPDKKGLRKRKMIRGNVITNDIVQVNVVIEEYGETPIENFLKKKEKGE